MAKSERQLEHLRKLNLHNRGNVEFGKRISAGKIGKKVKNYKSHKHSEETKRKIGEKNKANGTGLKKGFVHSEETKRKIGIKNTGKKPTVEQRKKMSESHIGLLSKEKHPNWKGGITPLSTRIRNTNYYRKWKKEILLNSNGCMFCKSIHRLEVDHYPIKFSELIKLNKIESVENGINCSNLWDMKNGRVLCRECHKKVHYDK